MKPQTVMIIDDDADDRFFFQEAVSRLPSIKQTHICDSGSQALALLQDSKTGMPDYIFLDLNMPLMNGKECLIELKKILCEKFTQIIILSTSDLKQDIDDVMELGAKLFLTKPNTFEGLYNMLKSVLEGRWHRKSLT
ncbi:response regulator receiver domain-containing protein [Chitinophaga niastensis]|uniref:Response regulator receiver domain-containing protein n=1 Tax=Chitinophaga niastensis TaxID=536980 RepID=A0A2P8HDU8_CHINA|nr:response regulator [Chitinophaga niastensis]PSL44372.1 response regulator receiver domain-containing protein [Chitinophaga niastensis]